MFTQDFVQTFLLSTIVNTFADQDPSRSWPEKVVRAALISVPVTVAVDTTRAIAKVANRFPNLGINDQTQRPSSEQALALQVSEKVQQTQLRIIASYTRPEDQWKNPMS